MGNNKENPSEKIAEIKFTTFFKEKYMQVYWETWASLKKIVHVKIPPNQNLTTFHRYVQILRVQFAKALAEVGITLKITVKIKTNADAVKNVSKT